MSSVRFVGTLAGAALFLGLFTSGTQAQTLRIAMTASDVPTVGGIPDNGSEGYRFAGYPIYDALVNWDFTKPQELADLTPGLATSWEAEQGRSAPLGVHVAQGREVSRWNGFHR